MSDLDLALTSEMDSQANCGQSGFEFPQPLTEKYKPSSLEDYVGLEKVKRAMANLIARPMPTDFFFLGSSGTGKTTHTKG